MAVTLEQAQVQVEASLFPAIRQTVYEASRMTSPDVVKAPRKAVVVATRHWAIIRFGVGSMGKVKLAVHQAGCS
jgi:hypothetical protein